MYIHGVEIMEESFAQKGSLFKVSLPCFGNIETIFRRGNALGSLHRGAGMMGKWGKGQGSGNVAVEKGGYLGKVHSLGKGEVMEWSIVVMGAHCPWKHPSLGLDIMGESTVGIALEESIQRR